MQTMHMPHDACEPSTPRSPARGRGIARAARGARHPYSHLDGEHPAPAIPTGTTDFGTPDALNGACGTPDNFRMAVRGRRPAGARGDPFAATIAAAQRGSASDCRALYDAHAGRVFGYLRFHGANDPEDLTSEVFLRVFNHLSDFSGTVDGFRAWVFTIARRVLIDDRRRRARRPVTVALASPPLEFLVGGDTELDALERFGDDRVAELLACLTPDQRDVIALRIIADLPISEVASVLGKEPGTIKALQHRGIAALRRHIEMAPS
jgi:RNA polymerase sigma-70 factor (ECF subfamily)